MCLTELGSALVTLHVYHCNAAQQACGSRRHIVTLEDYTKTETSDIYSLETREKRRKPVNAPQIKKKAIPPRGVGTLALEGLTT